MKLLLLLLAAAAAAAADVVCRRRYAGHHDGQVVKCCRFQVAGSRQLFADTGNSRDICVMDPRASSDRVPT